MLANEAVEKVVEGLPEDKFRDSKTMPKREIVQYSSIVKADFCSWHRRLIQNDFFYSFNVELKGAARGGWIEERPLDRRRSRLPGWARRK